MVMAFGRQHESIFSTESRIRLSFHRWRFDSKMEPEYRCNERRMLCDHSRLDDMWKPNRGAVAFLMANANQQGRIGSKRYDGREDLLWWWVLFWFDRGPENLIPWVFKLENGCRKRWWSEFGQLRDLLEHVHGSVDLHHLKTRIKKIIFMMMIRRMIRIKTMIGTWMAQRSRLALLSC
jgi:hypothetical protein